MPRDLWRLAESMASNPRIGKRIRQSSFVDKYRRKRGSDLAKAVVETGGRARRSLATVVTSRSGWQRWQYRDRSSPTSGH
jgi:hypothetical protein